MTEQEYKTQSRLEARSSSILHLKVSTMLLGFANSQLTRVQDLLKTLLFPREPQVDTLVAFPEPSQPSSPQDGTQTESTPVTETIVTKPSLFALLIGIDEYKHDTLNNLGASVADAKAVKTYLETSLGVPAFQIQTLYNSEATRDAIVDNIRAFQTNPYIRNGDPILIFYSGHGGTVDAPEGWEAGGPEIQIILSYDALCEGKGREIYGIPDRTMGALLDQLANQKGDNITVIFDCCHSGSLTRSKRSHLISGVEPEALQSSRNFSRVDLALTCSWQHAVLRRLLKKTCLEQGEFLQQRY